MLPAFADSSLQLAKQHVANDHPNHLIVYDLAIAADYSYLQAVGNGDPDKAYAAIIASVNRINTVFERDTGIRLHLVSGPDLISTNPDDPINTNKVTNELLEQTHHWISKRISWGETDVGRFFATVHSSQSYNLLKKDTRLITMFAYGHALSFINAQIPVKAAGYTHTLLEQTHALIQSQIGLKKFDIGHLFTTINTDSRALVGTACDDTFKGYGVSGSSNPTGDDFDIGKVAHEIGHQLGATHTFNASCLGQRQADHFMGTSYLSASAMEPGSGSTIMSYASLGICSPQNLQSHSDDYFHARSIEQIRQYTRGEIGDIKGIIFDGSTCYDTMENVDHSPKANAGDDYIIPANTPFILTGSATDIDSASATFLYTWEQFDLGKQTFNVEQMHTDQGSGPLIRSYPPTASPHRTIPGLSAILNGNLKANLGERLPTTDRVMQFMLTVRSGTHGISQDMMTVTSVASAGPFQITSIDKETNGKLKVQWQVAQTDQPPINCSHVDISFSTDGGHIFSYALAKATNNDGIETVLTNAIPKTKKGRIKVQCSDNIFFSISATDLTL